VTAYRCKECDRRVEMHYNHVGLCGPDSTDDDCPGTFSHPLRVRAPRGRAPCEVRDQDLTHEMVMVHVADAANTPNVEDEEEDRP
jgi:hypothetical protein